ncbi:MAG: hypothetical protein K1X88_11115 [Nannocystaceae bacterium]|nr:hypothetical protein [Nannocystaceae bacterium]
MPSLLQVLHDATGHGATEIVLEPGRAPTLRTSMGVETLRASMSEGELFDALSGVLGPDQQAELAVGNVVEFQLHDGVARWTLVAEAGVEGVVVRGRTQASGDVAEVGVPLELPPLRRGTEGVGMPAATTAAAPRKTRDTAWDLPAVTTTPPPAAGPAQVPSWLVSATELERDAPRIHVEPDPIDFALRRRPPTGEPPASLEDVQPHEQTAGSVDPFRELASLLPEGSLCLARGHGPGERLARHLGAYALILDAAEAQSVRADTVGVAFVLRLEDPSPLLGWALRRVEEGARVIVEVSARTPIGARRVLLGTGSAASADAWLSAVPCFWLDEEQGRWALARA